MLEPGTICTFTGVVTHIPLEVKGLAQVSQQVSNAAAIPARCAQHLTDSASPPASSLINLLGGRGKADTSVLSGGGQLKTGSEGTKSKNPPSEKNGAPVATQEWGLL